MTTFVLTTKVIFIRYIIIRSCKLQNQNISFHKPNNEFKAEQRQYGTRNLLKTSFYLHGNKVPQIITW